MAVFQEVTSLVDDMPELIVSKARENKSLANLCIDVDIAADELGETERSRRELYAAPTNPAFLVAWRDYEANYSGPVGQVRHITSHMAWDEFFGVGPAPDEESSEARWNAYAADWGDADRSFETRWNGFAERARSDANAIDWAIRDAKIGVKVCDDFPELDDYKAEVESGVAAWNSLVSEVGFDLCGVFRRRSLTPFVIIPRHVSGHYNASDPLSLMARLQQAQEAFVYGVPLGALAIMRSILEIILRKHYQLGDGKLDNLIKTAAANGLFPNEIRLSQIQTLLKLGNDAVHPNPENSTRFLI